MLADFKKKIEEIRQDRNKHVRRSVLILVVVAFLVVITTGLKNLLFGAGLGIFFFLAYFFNVLGLNLYWEGWKWMYSDQWEK